jgi:hypothetical protein
LPLSTSELTTVRPAPALRALAVSFCAAAALVVAAPARGSVEIGENAAGVTLRVDTAGNAEVTWTSGGERRSIVVARDGSLHFGASLSGPDVSHETTGVQLAWAVVVRQTPDGSFYALQSWRRLDDGPVELRFSRWTGAPTSLTLHVVCCKWGSVNVVGEATFHGQPIYGERATSQGAPLDPYGRNVYLDTFRSGTWHRMMGILTHKPTGRFSLWIRSSWVGSAYRGTIPGPNLGWTLGPDALAQAAARRG